jgi:hypothetical protein
LPSSIITALDLPWSASDIVTLGDGSETLFDLYTANVIWDGQYREIYIAESETEPLLGMANPSPEFQAAIKTHQVGVSVGANGSLLRTRSAGNFT